MINLNNTVFMNLSNASSLLLQNGELTSEYLVRNNVIQLNEKIALACFMIFISYFMANVFLPRSILGLREIKIKIVAYYVQKAEKFIFRLIDLFHHFALGCSLFVLWVCYEQGFLSSWMFIVFWGLIGLSFLGFLADVIESIRNFFIKNKGSKGGLKW